MMDFDLSKENIQPLRGGRNVSQLGMALQAQTNENYHTELELQRTEYEQTIRNYIGNDPLEVWYSYVSWVEQSYPKHGHEGNLLSLLEDCLSKFEDDSRYTNDRRFCKLWIKYIDMRPNPHELCQMMYSKGISKGCADFYKAWAYFQEASGDFQNANHIFELGKKELAQPYEELDRAHKNLIVAAGQHMLYGANHTELEAKRQALTSLQTYKPGRVGSIRQISHSSPGVLPSSLNARPQSTHLTVYEDQSDYGAMSGAEAPPISILMAAKSQDLPKENVMKAGPWVKVPVKKRSNVKCEGSSFAVHEDDTDVTPSQFPPETLENYKNWIVGITIPEEKDNRMVPMYPKMLVYSDIGTEYSLEELRSARDLRRMKTIKGENDKMVRSVVQSVADEASPEKLLKEEMTEDDEDDLPLSAFESSTRPVPQSPMVTNRVADFSVWDENNDDEVSMVAPKVTAPKFSIYQSPASTLPNHLPKGSAMKTPFKDLNADELAETGSRGGMDVAAAAPIDCAKRLPAYDEDFANISCSNTQVFNFNLNAMQVSTPQHQTNASEQPLEDSLRLSRKQLFIDDPYEPPQQKALSVIMEETKSYHSSSSGTTMKSYINHTKPSMAAISEEHHSNLAQNLMVNAALRSSLLGDLIDLNPPSHSSMTSPSPTPAHRRVEMRVPSPISISSPITYIPSDPFKPQLIAELLNRIGFPGPHTRGYYELSNVVRIQVKKDYTTQIGSDRYIIEKQLGKGTFGTVFRCIEHKTGNTVALKHQKPPNRWEFYICRELQSRLADHPLRERFMDVTVGYFSEHASILISEFMPCGSLLNVANIVKQKSGKPLKESLCIYFCMEMLKVVQAMHQVKIIHADVKPDNFLVQLSPDNVVTLQLIDFGCSIDMTLFPPNASFTRTVTTEDFVCCEMKDGRRWNYHTDLYCVAATAHVLLFDKYIQVQKKESLWSITNRLPRYLRLDLWNMFFSTLLNQQNGLADSGALLTLLDDSLKMKLDDYHLEMRYLLNVLKNR